MTSIMKSSVQHTAACLLVFLAFCLGSEARTLRVLAVGNSFSRNAVEQNLHELALAGGDTCIVGNLYIPGCSIEQHVGNARSNAAAYEYHKIIVDGTMEKYDGHRLGDALDEEPWDFVSVQQASPLSGLYESYSLLPELLSYIRHHCPASTRIVFHQTWAYAPECTHPGFANYGGSQQAMYEAIADCSRRIVRELRLAAVVPSGTAVQNARTSSLGTDLTADGYHLEAIVGQYIAACTWYEQLFRRRVVGNSYAPEGMSPAGQRLAQEAAHRAVRRPYRVSRLKG